MLKLVRRILVVTCVFILLVVGLASAQTPFKHQGLDLLHPPSSAIPTEQVDPASGTLTVVGTDLVLPGNAGFDLVIQRVYNSSVYPNYASGGDTTIEEDSWAGAGWKLHFGRIIHSDSLSGGVMQVEMGDGGRHALYHALGNPNVWTTTDFWLYNPATHVLQLPNGRVYTFDREVTHPAPLGTTRYVTEISDPFNNRITFSYFNAPGPIDGVQQIRQHLSGAQVREINFTYDATLKGLASMTYLTHTWTYDQVALGANGLSSLTSVHPPAGPATVYEYVGGELTAIVAPFGGRLAYVYNDATRVAGSMSTTTRVVTSRTASGRDVPTGTWTFAYGTGTNADTTTVSSPCAGVTKYRFNGVGTSGTFTGWSAGTLAELSVEENSVVLERRTFTWIQSELISNDVVAGEGGVWNDTAVYRPLLASQTTTQGSRSWTTNLAYHTGQGSINDYGNAYSIEELGETIYQWRQTTRTFQYGFTPYILGRVASETTTQNSAYQQNDGTTSSSWTYNLTTGALASQNIRGLTTAFESHADGNVAAVIDGRGNRTAFSYSWGQVVSVDSPELDTTFTIAPEGLVSSTTTGALTTTYGYDAGFRLGSVQQSGMNPTTYTPDDLHGSWVRVDRGSSQVTHLVDAFGRETSTYNSQGLRVGLLRDTCGRVYSTSDPYTTTPVTQGTTTVFDALGRTKQMTDPAGQVTTFTYNGPDVVRTDANAHATAFEYIAFGDPGNALLVKVIDAANGTTHYRYDVTGALTKVTGPLTGVERTWVVDSRGLVTSDTQPESGTTSYTYDAVGNVSSITDANGSTTTLTYDGNNRLRTRNAPGTIDDLTITYDSSGRLGTLAAENANTTFTYDVPNRTVTRTDQVAPGTFASIYTSDASGNLASLRYPSGRVVTYHYDAENRLTSLDHTPPGSATSSVFATAFAYGEDGRLASYMTGVVTHRFSYEANRPKRIWTTGGIDALDLFYSYDNVGNVQSIADPRANATQTFVPDPLNRLSNATGPWGTLTWTYDAAGNRLTETAAAGSTTYTYDGPTQRLGSTAGASVEAFTYDAVGRLTSDRVISQYAYSPSGKLTGATGTGMSASYTYDASGERLAKTVNGQTTYSFRSVGGQTLSEYQASCASPVWTRDVVYAGGRLLGAVKANLAQPSVAMVVSSATTSEGTQVATVTVRLTTTAPLTCPVSAHYQTSAGSALAGSDFSDSTGTITFAVGAVNGATQTIAVPVTVDAVHEDPETFSIGLSSANGGVVGAPATTTVTILDVQTRGDFDGDRRTDLVVWRPSGDGTWYWLISGSGYEYAQSHALAFGSGSTGDVPLIADLDGDRLNDLLVWRPGNGTWYWLGSASGYAYGDGRVFGGQGDIPLVGDIDGDGKSDLVIWRPDGVGTFYWLTSSNSHMTGGQRALGTTGDVPVLGDYDGDGKADLMVWRPSSGTWYWLTSSTGYTGGDSRVFGDPSLGDRPLVGDFDGDGKSDLAVWRASNGYWRWVKSSSGYDTSAPAERQFGNAAEGDTPVIADIDGDGRTDLVVWRASTGTYYWVTSSTAYDYLRAGGKQWGSQIYGDIPLPGGGGL